MKLHLPMTLLAALLACLSTPHAATAAELTWTGAEGNNVWTLNGTPDSSPWNGNAVYTDEDTVIFGTLEGQTLVEALISSTVTPAGLTFNSDTTSYTLKGTGAMAGGGTLSKSGTSTLRLETSNTNFSGTINLDGGVLELGADGVLGTGKIVWGGGTVKYGEGVTTDISNNMNAVTAGKDTIRIDTNGNNVVWSAYTRSKFAYVKTGDGALTLKPTSANTFEKDLTIEQGTLAFDSTNGAITFTANIKGNGGQLEKMGANALIINTSSALADYQGVVKVSSGTLQLGSANGSKLEFTGADIVVGDATLKLNGNGNNLHSVSNNIDLLNGAEIYIGNSSGPTEGSYQYTLSGNIRIGQSATDVVDITTQYAKTIGLTGTLSGEGTLQYLSVNNGTDDLANRKLFITGENTDFTGTVNVGSPDGTGDAPVKKRALVLAHQNALVNATVNLFNEDGYLQINNADKTGNIAGLNGKGIIAGESSGVASDSPDTLNLVQKDGLNTFTGTIADTVSLVRSGAGTFIFAGTNNGRITSSEGTLQLGNAAGDYTAGNVNIAGGSLNIGGSGTLSHVSVSSPAFGTGVNIFMDIMGAENDQLTYTGAGAVEVGGLSFNIDLASSTEDAYTLFTATTGTFTSNGELHFLGLNRGAAATISLSDDGKSVVLNVTEKGEHGNLVWNGGGEGIWITEGTAENSPWDITGNGDNKFYTGDHVTFDGTAAADKRSVAISGNVSPGSITVTADGYVFGGSGSITGGGKLTMDAEDGTLTINTANAYTGGTELLKGNIAVNHAQAFGSGSVAMATGTGLTLGNGITLANSISMTGDGIFTISGDKTATLNGLLSDTAENSAGKLVKSGDGTLVLGNASNTYTGGTQITGGTLSFDYATRTALGTGGIEVGQDSTLLYAVNASGGKTTSFFSNNVTGTGTIILDNTGQDETKINNAVFAGFEGELVLRGNLRFHGETGDSLASIQAITVESGTHLYMDNESSAGTPWNQNFTIAGTGTGTGNDKAGALRMDNTTISGNLTLSADASIIVYIAGTSTISGNLIGGDHVLTFNPNNNADRKLVLSGASVAAGGIGSTRAGTLILGGGTGEDSQNTVAELGAGGLNLNANTVLELNNVTIRATEQWAQSVGSNTVTLADGTTNTIDTNKTDITFTGNVGGEGSLVKDGDGTLPIGAGSNYTGETTVSGGTLNMNGAALAGNISLGYGSLANAQNATGNISIRQDTPDREPSSVSLGGMSGSKLNSYQGSASRTEDKAASVTNIGSGNISLSNSTLGISSDMVGDGSGAVFSFSTAADGSVTLSGNLLLQLTDSAAEYLLKDPNNSPLINITNGTLTLGGGTTISFDTPYNIYGSFFDSSVTSNGGSLVLQPKEGGSDWLIQKENDPPLTFNDTNKTIMESMGGIHNNGIINIDITGTEEMQLKNLEGASSSAQINTGGNEGLTLILVNAGDITHSTYQGSIEGDAAIRKEGAEYAMSIGGNVRTSSLDVVESMLSIGGKLTTAQATVMEDGELVLNGTGSSIDALNITSGRLTLGKNATAFVDSLMAYSSSPQKGMINLGSGSELTILSTTALSMAVTGSGTFTVSGAGNTFSLTQDGSISNDTTLALRDGASTTVDGVLSLGALAGDGTVDLDGGMLELHNASAVFSGIFRNTGTIQMNGTGSQTLVGPGSADVNLGITQGTLVLRGNGVTYGHVVVGNVGTLSLVSDNGVPHLHTTKDFFMGDGSTLDIHMNVTSSSELGAAVSSAGTVHVGDASINLYNDASSSFNAENRTLDFVLMEGNGGTTATLGSGHKLTAGFLSLLYNLRLEAQGSNIVLLGDERTDSPYLAASTTHNSLAGGALLNESKWIIAGDQTSNLYLISDSIARDMENGNMASATRKLAAVAGSTVNALGTAQRDALREQMGWIRNRTNQMGVNPAYINEDLPYFHMWMEGTGSYAQLDTKGDESGYKLTTWGGTFGVDADLSDSFTMGAAFTANYGDLTAGAADTADGHLDSYYANLFGRYQSKRWAHTLILTGGWNDAKLNRTVDYGAGSYRTEGSTNGWGLGAMYELTYDIYLNENRSSILQPLFNASVVTTRMDGYRETGAGNAGLSVDKQEWTTGTLALGGRWMGLVGSNLFGREALAELRVNAAQDLGDDRGETAVGFLANPGYTQQVRGAKVGRTALQIGAGLSVPVGTQGTIFVNGNADIRNGASSLNGSIGYRYDF